MLKKQHYISGGRFTVHLFNKSRTDKCNTSRSSKNEPTTLSVMK